MALAGESVPADILSKKIDPNIALVVISDEKGELNVIKIDRNSIKPGESLVRVAGGCWLRINGAYKWFNPCPL